MKSFLTEEVLRYIILFLTGKDCLNKPGGISYTSNLSDTRSKLVIIPSSFFAEGVYLTEKSIPDSELKSFNGVPLLFGIPKMEIVDSKIIMYADLIASTFFLITRYEEYIKRSIRDQHGRFLGKESTPYKLGFIDTPIVDSYSRILREILGFNKRNSDFSIVLTHDVDTPWRQYNFWGAVRETARELIKNNRFTITPFRNYLGIVENDPTYCFSRFIELDSQIKDSKVIYFIKSGGHHFPEDTDVYIDNKNFAKLYKLLSESQAEFGYHVSYSAGIDLSQIRVELLHLMEKIKCDVHIARNHYLCSREPEDFYALMESGITDDYTMGYADIAGFRLGTCRPVKWIDPDKMKVTDLTLHPLCIMDCTLSSPKYMGLTESDADRLCVSIINKVIDFNGELVLLWHNREYPSRDLLQYERLIQWLSKIGEK